MTSQSLKSVPRLILWSLQTKKEGLFPSNSLISMQTRQKKGYYLPFISTQAYHFSLPTPQADSIKCITSFHRL